MKYSYVTKNTCAKVINFDLNDGIVTNVEFLGGGCPGNLKALPRLVNGMSVDEIEKSLDNGEQRQLLRDILIRQGYIHRNEYDEHGFVCTIINRYAVTQSFPALRKKDIPTAIANSNYLLSLSAIQDFLKEN